MDLPAETFRRGGADDGAGTSSGMEIKGWESQARDIVFDITQSDKYKSVALHAEVKLAEALERCTRVCPTAYAPGGEEKPNKLKTAVCCQVGRGQAMEAMQGRKAADFPLGKKTLR